MRNYVKIEKKSMLFNYYAYVDTEEFLADDIFMKENMKVCREKVGKQEDSEYVVVICKVLKTDKDKFRMVMKDLYYKMIVLGHTKHATFFSELETA